MKRGIMPTRQKIADYWTNTDEGQERIRQIKESYKIDVTNLACIDRDMAHCWACNKTMRSGSKGYNVPDLGLQRCHVIPHSLGGSNHPSNLILMCSPCHEASPDTNEELYFWEWLSSREHYVFKWAKEITKHLGLLPQNFKGEVALSDSLKHVRKSLQPVTVHGRFSDSTKKAMIREIIRHQGGQS